MKHRQAPGPSVPVCHGAGRDTSYSVAADVALVSFPCLEVISVKTSTRRGMTSSLLLLSCRVPIHGRLPVKVPPSRSCSSLLSDLPPGIEAPLKSCETWPCADLGATRGRRPLRNPRRFPAAPCFPCRTAPPSSLGDISGWAPRPSTLDSLPRWWSACNISACTPPLAP